MKQYIHNIVLATILLSLSHGAVQAQQSYADQLAIENLSLSKKQDVTAVGMEIHLDRLDLNRNDMLIVTPVVLSNQGDESIELESFAVIGKLRERILNRPFSWKGKPVITVPEAYQVVRENNTDQSLRYVTTLPYEAWQRDARLVLRSQVIGCADCLDPLPDKVINPKILPDLFIPQYRFSYLTPEVEEIKQRSESYSAHLNYIVGRSDLLPNFENNAVELAKVDKIIRELQEDKDLTITDFTISGYASPEGSSQSNLLLSQRRAESFATHIEKKYNYPRDRFKVQWFGEDWDGLRTAVAASSLANKGDIVTIIDSEPNPDARDARLIALDNRATYHRLLQEFYPPLRRNDYEISFVSRDFNVEEAAEVMKTRPKLLSLNEMFHVANTFPEDSPQYKEVFDLAANLFPEDPTANINAAVSALRANDPDATIERLSKIEGNPDAWNLIGIAYAMKGDLEQAKEYLGRAAGKSHTDALHNLEQLEKYINDIE